MMGQKLYAVQYRTSSENEWRIWSFEENVFDSLSSAQVIKKKYEYARDKFAYTGPFFDKATKYRIIELKVGEVLE